MRQLSIILYRRFLLLSCSGMIVIAMLIIFSRTHAGSSRQAESRERKRADAIQFQLVTPQEAARKDQRVTTATLGEGHLQHIENPHEVLRVLSDHQSKPTRDHNQLKSLPADELNALLRRMQLGLESEPNLCHNSYEMEGELKIEPIVKICLDSTVYAGACNVVSLGIDYNFIFDDLMLSWGCEVRSFDPSMRPGEYDRGPRHKFYHVGIAGHSGTNVKNTLFKGERYSGVDSFQVKSLAKIMQEQQFGHAIVRMDTEGAEWDTLENWLEADLIDKVDQLFLEIHMYTPNEYLRYARILQQLQTRMDLFWMTVNVQAPGRVGDCADCELKVWELGYKRH